MLEEMRLFVTRSFFINSTNSICSFSKFFLFFPVTFFLILISLVLLNFDAEFGL
jgi:hypothetical protein